jgi:hypothetical protein
MLNWSAQNDRFRLALILKFKEKTDENLSMINGKRSQKGKAESFSKFLHQKYFLASIAPRE